MSGGRGDRRGTQVSATLDRAGAGPPEHDREAPCPSCGARGLAIVYEQPSVPVQSILLLDDRETARAFPRGQLRLGLCAACGFISNTRFDAAVQEFSARYEETQGFSPRFREFATELARGWIDRYDLDGKTVLEIGCGKGEFLALMCELGAGRGIGFDPAYVEGRLESPARDRLEMVADYYSEEHADVRADLVVCRHTLEHIHNTRDFLGMVRAAVGDDPDTIVAFEVPDAMRVLRDVAFWDIFYEHCSYFTAGALARLFRSSGFELLDLRLEYAGQYLILEACPAAGPVAASPGPLEEGPDDVHTAALAFRDGFARKVAEWRDRLDRLHARGGRAVVWGSGSKSVGFLTTLGLDDQIELVVDINPIRHGTFVAGTGHPIVSPEALVDYQPELVVVMNPIYLDEIGRDLDRLGVRAELVGL